MTEKNVLVVADQSMDIDAGWESKATLYDIVADAYDRADIISGSPEQDDLDIECEI